MSKFQIKFFFLAIFILATMMISERLLGAESVNDVHSALNETRVLRVVKPKSIEDIQGIIRNAAKEGLAISIAGSRHAMGGQQFGEGTILIDMLGMNRIIDFDSERGVIHVEAGIEWPKLIDYLVETQKGQKDSWGIIQKQTGADRLSIGGALSANIHGRGLKLKPFINDVESFTLVDASGKILKCSREENKELFRLVIGGYGLFGVIASVELRLQPRIKIERVVEVLRLENLISAVEDRVEKGYLYGDFQYYIDTESRNFMQMGIFPTYRPAPQDAPITEHELTLTKDEWENLYYLNHENPFEAFKTYASYYLRSSGQVYWSDTHQRNIYIDHYHKKIDKQKGLDHRASEMITEIYVPREDLVYFMRDVRRDFIESNVHLFYGTIRFIEKDDESFLAWAKERYAAVIFNLHINHTPEGITKAKRDFRGLIDRAIKYGGSYFLTYHRWATREQVEKCYPQFIQFLKAKLKYDPQERFQSEWYRHYKKVFADDL